MTLISIFFLFACIDSEEDVEIELATAVLTPVSEYVRKKYDDELLFFIAVDVSIVYSI